MEYDTIFVRKFYETGSDGKIKLPEVPPGWKFICCLAQGNEIWALIFREKGEKRCAL